MKRLDSDGVRSIVKEKNVKFIRLQFTDLFGKLKNVSIPSSQLDAALNNQIMFDGSSIEGFVRVEESDMYLVPDPSTFAVFPWRSSKKGKTGRLICDVYGADGKPFEGCSRNILKKVLKDLATEGYEFFVGPEVEFFLFETDERGNPLTTTHDQAGYFDMAPDDCGEDARRDMILALEDLGFEIEASHHECAPGQHEIDFKYGEALKTADDISTFKLVVKTIAKQHGLYATFMPKPITGSNGTCMHLNMSLFKEGNNIFRSEKDDIGLSQEAYYFIGGLLKYAREYSAITNASVNSYKRLIPGYEAPTDIAWASGNRSPLVRIPATTGEATRVELRSPDPTANHYLALAVVLAAGLEGIRKKISPPDCFEGNLYDLESKERAEKHISKVPENLKEAVLELQKSSFMKKVLGSHAHGLYTKAKMVEWDEYNREVHQWELNKYLNEY